ncbi:hypothetical protein M2137_001845 [Parabacteroides sp. PFB2-10]|nr:hypothetical protein [Parabacteroides sp. PFB2-10]
MQEAKETLSFGFLHILMKAKLFFYQILKFRIIFQSRKF